MSLSETTAVAEAVIIPPNLAVRAMRDSGYRNTASALAELIDNSVQADASDVEVICIEESKLIKKRHSRRIKSIGVLDNGSGMMPDVLQIALQFGNGTHLYDRKGIGRFGMGLPNSSISQCRRVEVWTWQSGPDNAVYTYLDVDEIEEGSLTMVPAPKAQSLPAEWRDRSEIVDTTGTLVLWSHFDPHRLTWRGAKATLDNTEKLVGRMYRKFIDRGQLTIRLLALENEMPTINAYVKINDPLYLMKNTSTPPPFDKEPMFQKWGEDDEVFHIDYDNKKHIVTVRMSWAREETIPEIGDRGGKPYGKHAAKNLGVSIVRAGRELALDSSWTNSYNPTERWWGVEVEFPPALDEVFGVTNNKQSATIFEGMSQFNWRTEAEPGESSVSEFIDRIQSESDPRALLLPIVEHIRQQIGQVRTRLDKQTEGRRTAKKDRHDTPTVADVATNKVRERVKQGYETGYDKEEFKEKDRDEFEKNLITDKHYSKNAAQKIANAVLSRKRKIEFLTKDLRSYAFFDVEHHHGGLTAIVFNTNHPFYSKLMETLHPNIGDETDAKLIDRINQAADTLNLLFAAWARYETEETRDQIKLFEMRQEWGKMAQVFLTESEEDE